MITTGAKTHLPPKHQPCDILYFCKPLTNIKHSSNHIALQVGKKLGILAKIKLNIFLAWRSIFLFLLRMFPLLRIYNFLYFGPLLSVADLLDDFASKILSFEVLV